MKTKFTIEGSRLPERGSYYLIVDPENERYFSGSRKKDNVNFCSNPNRATPFKCRLEAERTLDWLMEEIPFCTSEEDDEDFHRPTFIVADEFGIAV